MGERVDDLQPDLFLERLHAAHVGEAEPGRSTSVVVCPSPPRVSAQASRIRPCTTKGSSPGRLAAGGAVGEERVIPSREARSSSAREGSNSRARRYWCPARSVSPRRSRSRACRRKVRGGHLPALDLDQRLHQHQGLGVLALPVEGPGEAHLQAPVVRGLGQGLAVLRLGLPRPPGSQEGVGQVLTQGDIVRGRAQGLAQGAHGVFAVLHLTADRKRWRSKGATRANRGRRRGSWHRRRWCRRRRSVGPPGGRRAPPDRPGVARARWGRRRPRRRPCAGRASPPPPVATALERPAERGARGSPAPGGWREREKGSRRARRSTDSVSSKGQGAATTTSSAQLRASGRAPRRPPCSGVEVRYSTSAGSSWGAGTLPAGLHPARRARR